ncbi:MAG: hypothetical protein GQF41_3017 [Candidatus Rifleibacterium amylolyticum]|nr:MAG: hypothetical protein GQF41_3017 [Candidatus Rifleibacterium amylolyticum]
MTLRPSPDAENAIPLRHEFVCTGFVERIASWARFLCLSFLFIQLLAIAINLVFPFAIDPPPFFNQILFFLLACAAFEIFAIPIEAIKDHCIIDLQKAMVVKVYNRYLFTRVEVISPFDNIRAIGVSSRAAPIWRNLFSDSPLRYAILILSDKSIVTRLTDYNLSLDAANKLVKSLHESYLRNANVTYGSRNVELVFDHTISNTLITRHCERSTLSLVDAAVLPAFQAGLGTALVIVLIGITAMVGDFVAEQLFSTSLKIANQPVFQLLVSPGTPSPEQTPLTPPEGPPPADPSSAQNRVAAVQAAPEQVAIATTEVSTLSAALPDSASLETQSQPSSEDIVTGAITEITTTPLETPPGSTASTDLVVEAKVAAEPEKTEPIKEIDSAVEVVSHEPETTVKAAVSGDLASSIIHKTTLRPEAYVLVPLPSRVPSLDEKSILAANPEQTNADKPSPLRIILPDISPSRTAVANSTEVQPPTPKFADSRDTTADISGIIEKTAEPAQSEALAKVSEVKITDYIGQDVESVIERLGKPVANIKSSSGQQLIYSGITMQTDASGSTIRQVNLTSQQSKILGPLYTHGDLAVGSTIREARRRLGVPQENPDSPGLHFPKQGISIYPLPGAPDIIGSIKLYKRSSD